MPDGRYTVGLDGVVYDTKGKKVKSPTKEEVNFLEDGGYPQRECAACQFFESGKCRLLKLKVKPGDICDSFVEILKDGKKSAQEVNSEVIVSAAVEIPLFINRVSRDRQTGQRRWYATASGIEEDLYKERMSVGLYKDFIKRIETREPAPEPFVSAAWNGGLPYLGIAHYLDLDGYAIVGPTDQVYIDGSILKMRGTFADTNLANKAYEAIQKDIADKTPQNERVRVSIAFIDWSHNHEGIGSFIRESLSDKCSHCENGVGEKIYVSGQLVHLALTRRPAYTDTDITLEERAMEMKDNRNDDALSIVGDEEAEELEKRQKITVRSGIEEIAEGAIVIKDKHGDSEEYEDDDDEDMKKNKKKKKKKKEEKEEGAAFQSFLGGAKSLDEADAFLEKSEVELIDSWGIFADVLSNIIVSEETPSTVRAVVRDFQSRLDIVTARAVIDVQKALNGGVEVTDEKAPETQVTEEVTEAVAEPTPAQEPVAAHVLDEALIAIRTAYDDAVETPGEVQEKLAMLQPAVNELAETIQRGVASPGGVPVPVAGISMDQLTQALAPLYAKMEGLEANALAPVERAKAGPISRRAISARSGVLPIAEPQPVAKPGSLTSIIRKTVGLSG